MEKLMMQSPNRSEARCTSSAFMAAISSTWPPASRSLAEKMLEGLQLLQKVHGTFTRVHRKADSIRILPIESRQRTSSVRCVRTASCEHVRCPRSWLLPLDVWWTCVHGSDLQNASGAERIWRKDTGLMGQGQDRSCWRTGGY